MSLDSLAEYGGRTTEPESTLPVLTSEGGAVLLPEAPLTAISTEGGRVVFWRGNVPLSMIGVRCFGWGSPRWLPWCPFLVTSDGDFYATEQEEIIQLR